MDYQELTKTAEDVGAKLKARRIEANNILSRLIEDLMTEHGFPPERLGWFKTEEDPKSPEMPAFEFEYKPGRLLTEDENGPGYSIKLAFSVRASGAGTRFAAWVRILVEPQEDGWDLSVAGMGKPIHIKAGGDTKRASMKEFARAVSDEFGSIIRGFLHKSPDQRVIGFHTATEQSGPSMRKVAGL